MFPLAAGKRTRTQFRVPETDSELRAREPGSQLLEAGLGEPGEWPVPGVGTSSAVR